LALANHFRHSKERTFNNTSLQYNIERLNQINKRVKLPYIKNDLSYYYMVRFLNNAKDVNDFETVFKTFSQVNTNEKSITNVSEIINAYTRLKPGLSLPDIIIIDKYDTEKKLRHLISKPTVMFFWSKLYKHHLNDAHSKASELSEKYPEIEFVAVNADNISSKNQAHILRQNQISYSNEFHFKNPENAKDLLAIRPINNVFLIDDEAKIVNPKANMFSVDFEHQLVELINQ
jgi:vacuolar-type H+-ATPase subunit C/Vma6